MREVFIFYPPRRQGMLLHGSLAIVLALLIAIGIWRASVAESGARFLIFLLMALLSIAILLVIIYRMYALQQARYILARDGISLHWGLRHEEIPINEISWVVSTVQNRIKLSKPLLRLPGAVLGVRPQPDGKQVEFMASQDARMVLIVTIDQIFAISPAKEDEFLLTFRRLSEYGSLTPIQPESIHPAFLLARSWADRPARILLISSAVLAFALITLVSLAIPSHSLTALRLNAAGSPVELVPGIRLLLLPVLNTFFFIADLVLGLFFYRRADTQSLGYLMWGSSVLTSLIFSAAVFFILRVT